MRTLVGFVGLLIVLILGAGIFGLVGLIGVVRLIDLVAAVQAGGHIAAVVDDIAVLVLVLARRHLTVAVAVALDGGILLAGLRLGGAIFRRGFGSGGRFRFCHIGFGRLVRQLDQGCVGVGSCLGGSIQEDAGRGVGCRVRQRHGVDEDRKSVV